MRKAASLPFPLVEAFLTASAKRHPANQTHDVAGYGSGRHGGDRSDGSRQAGCCFGAGRPVAESTHDGDWGGSANGHPRNARDQ